MIDSAPPSSDPDAPWKPVSSTDLYHLQGNPVNERRPYFQGDLFRGVALPRLPTEMPLSRTPIDFDEHLVMLLPHPCSCYAGDVLRTTLTVSPVHYLDSNARVTGGDWRTQSKFPVPQVYGDRDGWVDLTSIYTLPSSWLPSTRRVASLTLLGVSWLHKRLLKYMTRLNWSVDKLAAQLKRQWDDVALWEVWSEVRGAAEGYESWKKQEIAIPWLGDVIPDQLIPGRTEHLIAFLRGVEPEE